MWYGIQISGYLLQQLWGGWIVYRLKYKEMRNIQMKMKKTTFITQGAVIAAIYVVLVFVFDYWSFGPIQFRVAEALTILPVFTPVL